MSSRLRAAPLTAEAIQEIIPQPAQQNELAHIRQLSGPWLDACCRRGWAVWRGSECIFIGGFMEQWPGLASGWAVLAALSTKELLYLTRSIGRHVERLSYRRLEMTVVASFAAGHRWARLLGFQVEGYMRAYDPLGRDHVLYARIKDGTSTPSSCRYRVERRCRRCRRRRPGGRGGERGANGGRPSGLAAPNGSPQCPGGAGPIGRAGEAGQPGPKPSSGASPYALRGGPGPGKFGGSCP